MKQESRHRVALIIAWASWIIAFGLTALRVTDHIGQTVGIVIVLFIGTAIGAGTALSRMRLASTMTSVFQAGMRAAVQQATEIQNGDSRHDVNSRQGVDSSRE
jgi:hypothetical protein